MPVRVATPINRYHRHSRGVADLQHALVDTASEIAYGIALEFVLSVRSLAERAHMAHQNHHLKHTQANCNTSHLVDEGLQAQKLLL
jgi:hypothetical protein